MGRRRILRAHPGKTTAEIHDYHDIRTPVLAASLARRAPGYTHLGFPRSPPGRFYATLRWLAHPVPEQGGARPQLSSREELSKVGTGTEREQRYRVDHLVCDEFRS